MTRKEAPARCVQRFTSVGRVEDVSRDPDAGQPPLEGAERAGDSAPPAADVVRVHRVEEVEVARRVEAGDQLLAVPRQIRLDGERITGAGLPPEARLQLVGRPVRQHPDHPRERQPLGAEPLHGEALDVVPADPPRRVRGGGREDDDGIGPLREGGRPLERDHPSQGAARRHGDPRDAESVEDEAARAAPCRASSRPRGRPVPSLRATSCRSTSRGGSGRRPPISRCRRAGRARRPRGRSLRDRPGPP